MQSPSFVTFGRGAARQGDQVRFACPVQKALFALYLLFASERGQQPSLGEALTDTADGQGIDFDLCGDLSVGQGPSLLGFIGQEQDAGAFALPLRAFLGLALTGRFFAVCLGQAHMILFGRHEELLRAFPLFYPEEVLGPFCDPPPP